MAQYPPNQAYPPGNPYQPGGYQQAPYRPDPYAQDKSHLNMLAIFYYIKGGLSLFGALFPLIYVVFGVIMVFGGAAGTGRRGNDAEELFVIGIIIILFGGFLSLLLGALGICEIMTGRNLQTHRKRTFCLVVAAINCLNVPLGTILGVFTFVVLGRPTVQQMFR